jgi:hypothetical protein
MNLITITDEMLESAHIEESDRENLKKARGYGEDRMQINVEASISQAFIRELSFNGLNYLFDQVRSQNYLLGYTSGLEFSLRKLNQKLARVKESGLMNEDYINGWDDAIFDLTIKIKSTKSWLPSSSLF